MPLSATVQIALGVGAAVGFVFLARSRYVVFELRLYALGLAVAALARLGFTADLPTLRPFTIEIVGVAVFIGIAGIGLRGRPTFLAIGWAAHAAWDLYFHAGYVPEWYLMGCVGFDLALAIYVPWRLWTLGRARE